MKISINSTFSYIKFNLNYGSVLQCYALQKYLRNRNHEVEHLRDYRANPVYIIKRLKNIRYFKGFCKKTKAMITLQKFVAKNLGLSKKGYLSDAALKKHCPDVDCHIVGSDQIWHNANNFRYLTYAPEDALKLSYAASFGRADISQEMKDTIQPWLQRFQGISVREKSAVSILNSMGLEAVHLLDPTLLLNWEEYPYKEIQREKYCYCYFLNLKNTDGVAFDIVKQIVAENKEELVITAPLNYPMFHNENVIFPSVEEWLGLYKNAECIFTNTYHGLLFCIIFKKQFVFFTQSGAQKSENERFYSLLETLHLENRIVSEKTRVAICTIMNQKIDYEKVYTIINEQRLLTEQFFNKHGI